MSAAAMSTSPAPELPLFYRRVVGVDPTLHAALRLQRGQDYAFAAAADHVPLGLSEFEGAAQHYPILFSTGAAPVPVALLGLRQGQNLFVLPTGAWRDGSYVPAYCRAFPFILVHTRADDKTYIGMEADAACLRTDAGEPLFADGKPAPALEQAIAFSSEYSAQATAAAAFGKALAEQGLLEEDDAEVRFTGGGTLRVKGFQVVRPDRLGNVADEVFLEWRRRGWLAHVYAHLFSLGRWPRLIELAATAGGAI